MFHPQPTFVRREGLREDFESRTKGLTEGFLRFVGKRLVLTSDFRIEFEMVNELFLTRVRVC